MEGQLLTVKVGPYFFGAPVTAVSEILAEPEITAIPQTPPSVAGVALVRGQPLTVLTLRPWLNLPSVPVSMALRWGGHRGRSLIAVDQVENLWTPSDALERDGWLGLLPPTVSALVTDGYRFQSEWLWAWAEDLPERLHQTLSSAT